MECLWREARKQSPSEKILVLFKIVLILTFAVYPRSKNINMFPCDEVRIDTGTWRKTFRGWIAEDQSLFRITWLSSVVHMVYLIVEAAGQIVPPVLVLEWLHTPSKTFHELCNAITIKPAHSIIPIVIGYSRYPV